MTNSWEPGRRSARGRRFRSRDASHTTLVGDEAQTRRNDRSLVTGDKVWVAEELKKAVFTLGPRYGLHAS
jgi:hypothetical protein